MPNPPEQNITPSYPPIFRGNKVRGYLLNAPGRLDGTSLIEIRKEVSLDLDPPPLVAG